jgi:ketosteroid isomerase-like protein
MPAGIPLHSATWWQRCKGTGKPVEIAFCVVVGFKGGKISHEHIYWDQAGVLVQVGLLDQQDCR